MFARWMRIAICAILLIAIIGNGTAEAAGSMRIIVRLKAGALIQPVLNLLGAEVLDVIPEINLYLLRLPSLPLLSSLTLSLLGVVYLENDTTINNPTYRNTGTGVLTTQSLPDFYKAQPSLTRVRANEATAYYDGYGVIVADINSAVDYSHPALQGHLAGGYDFVTAQGATYATLNQSSSNFLDQSSSNFLDQSSTSFLDASTATFLTQTSSNFLDNGSLPAGLVTGGNVAYSHGTMCAGLIAAVAPRAMIMPLTVFDQNGRADVFTIAKAIRHAKKNGAHVINMSFGMNTNSRTVSEAITEATNANITVVGSAGNANSSTAQYPAAYSTAISVAATDLTDKKAAFSNFGSAIDVDAPGVNIISAFPGGYYAVASGTSFAAPIVAGEAALVRSKQATGVRTAVVNGSVNIYSVNPGYTGKLGTGRIDAMKAIGR